MASPLPDSRSIDLTIAGDDNENLDNSNSVLQNIKEIHTRHLPQSNPNMGETTIDITVSEYKNVCVVFKENHFGIFCG